jgi:CrcB protein
MLPTLFAIFLGSGLGGITRYGMVVATTRLLGQSFPYGTLLVNVVGGLAIGYLAGRWAQADAPVVWRSFLITGVLGGFTTFSAFTLDAYTLYERNQPWAALGYVLASVAAALLALVAGLALARLS